MNIKKSATMILAAIMAATALSACGSSPAKSTPASAVTPPSSAPASAVAPSSSAASTSETIEKVRMGLLERNNLEDAGLSAWSSFSEDFTENPFEMMFFPSLNAMLLELDTGKIESIILPRSVCQYVVASNNKIVIGEQSPFDEKSFYMATLAENTKLNKELSSAIDALKADGTIDKLVQEYLGENAKEPAPITLTKKEGGKTYKVAITGDMPPLDYIAADGTPAGFNVALLNAVSEKTGCNFEVVQVEASARLSALKSGKADFVFWMRCATMDESIPKQEGVALTSPYHSERSCVIFYSDEVHPKPYKIYKDALENRKANSAAS